MHQKKRSPPFDWRHFIPKSIICLQEGYTKKLVMNDVFAGVSVGIIALPLAMAFAIGSGLPPERGIYTAIIAGFLISALGGSRVQIGGPTGAFVVIVFDIVHRQGYEGLVVATLLAGLILFLMGIFRLGALLKFIPYPVVTGFTTGIALIIFSSQLRDFFGLAIAEMPGDFLGKWQVYWKSAATFNGYATILALGGVVMILWFRRYLPKVPGAMIAVLVVAICAAIFQLPVETIHTTFGEIPRSLPALQWPSFSMAQIRVLMPDAITIALLAALESLLSAVVADGMTGQKHKSNCELIAQGAANIGSVLFGGIPATGAIARTATNIRLGAKTPLSGITHALTLLVILLLLAPLAAQIPLCVLSAVLVVVAWNMAELDHFIDILKSSKSDAAILLVTFGLTVLVDLTVAVEVGFLLAAVLFVKKMSEVTHLKVCRKILQDAEEGDADLKESEGVYSHSIPLNVEVFEFEGPLFFGASDLLDEAIRLHNGTDQVFILRMRSVMAIDISGIHALANFNAKCKRKGVIVLLSGVKESIRRSLRKAGFEKELGQDHIFRHIDEALAYAGTITENKPK